MEYIRFWCNAEKPEYYDVDTGLTTEPAFYEDSEELMKDTINSVRNYVAKINSIDNNATLAGFPASKIELTYVDNPNELVEPRYATLYFMMDKENRIGYMLQYRSTEDKYDKYLPTFEKMVSSFRIND